MPRYQGISDRAWGSDRETGAALILFLGVAATVTILAAGLLTVVLNTQHNTRREATRTKAFDVAEAALDVAMMELAKDWPTDAPPPAFATESYRSAFRSTFETTEFPDPATAGASFVSVCFFDDQTSTNPYDSGPNGPNGRLLVDAQAVVGIGAARIRAEVQAVYIDVSLAPKLMLWTGGGIDYSGNEASLQVLGWPTDGSYPSYATLGTLPDPTIAQIGIGPLIPAPTREEVLSTTTIEALVQLAKDTNRYFGVDDGQPHISLQDGTSHVYTDATAAWQAAESDYGMEGLIVIDAPGAGTTLRLGQGEYNSELAPGILFVMDRHTDQPATFVMGGNTTFWGLIYSQGAVEMDSTGTCEIIGMLIAEGSLTIRGTANIRYHDRVLSGLSSQWATSTRLVPGGWRELSPEPTRLP